MQLLRLLEFLFDRRTTVAILVNKRPFAEFKSNSDQLAEQVREGAGPLIISEAGKSDLVLLTAEAYQQLLEQIEEAETLAAIQEGFDALDRGDEQPVHEMFEEIRQQYGIPR